VLVPPEEKLTGRQLPVRILDLPVPPEALYVRGELPRGPAVAVVGTRSCSRESRDFARALAHDLSLAGVTVLSGGAEGIDTAAHRGALDAHGRTVVVAPSGFSRPFPAENAALFQQIVLSGGVHVSLVSSEVPANRGSFFARNALLVALSHAVIVVEAGYRSGARNAAAQARRLGRLLLVVPQAPWNWRGLGCIEELKQGARPIKDARDVLRILRTERLHPLPFGSRPEDDAVDSQPQITLVSNIDGEVPVADSQRVLAAVREQGSALDHLCAATGLAVADVQRILLSLRLRGALVGDGRGGLCLPSS